MPYTVIIHRDAKKDIKKLHPQVRKRVVLALELIEENPRLRGSEKMSGYSDLYKYRVGHYRIIYRVNDDKLEVLVLDTKPRGEVYKEY